MTEIGLIARADNRGLGQQTWAFYRHMRPAKTLVVDCPSQKPLKLHPDRFPDATIVKGIPNRSDIINFLTGLDVVYTAETGYTKHLWREADRMGVRTVLHANYEFWDITDTPTTLAAASEWHLGDYGREAVFLPVPIETDRFTPHTGVRARRWLHPIGRPAIHDRNGTTDLLMALQFVTADIEVTITCQESGYVGGLINRYGIRTPDNVTVRVESSDALHYWTKYDGQDAVVLPRRFGGLCLPANEAVGAGIPVIMPDIEPNNIWLPPEWLTKASRAGDFQAKQPIRYYRTDPHQLAAVMDRFATDSDFYRNACAEARSIARARSWLTLQPRYECFMSA